MVDYRTEDEVRATAIEFRKENDALDWSVSIDELIKLHGYSQEKYHQFSLAGMGKWFASTIREAKKRVKALVSVKDKVILVASDLHARRVPFAKAHELGHVILPWHKDILYACDEHDLSPATQAQLEFEANTFASELLLPKDLLEPYYRDFPTSLRTVMLVQEQSGASIEASAVAYVKHHPGACALLTLEDVRPDDEDADGMPHLKLIRKSLSNSALRTPLSNLKRDQTFPHNHVLYKASRSTDDVVDTAIYIGEKEKDQKYNATVVNNTYKVFALLVE